jgi:hypothetical protein
MMIRLKCCKAERKYTASCMPVVYSIERKGSDDAIAPGGCYCHDLAGKIGARSSMHSRDYTIWPLLLVL